MAVLVVFCELFWNASCINFIKPKSVLDDWMSTTMTDMQIMCHFIDSHPSIIQHHGMDSFSVFLCRGCEWASWSFYISGTHATISEHSYPFTRLLCDKAVSILCWKSVIDFCPWYNFSLQKSYHCMLLFFGAYEKQSGHIRSATIIQLAGQGRKYFTIM
jgi:hypothetical protein